MARLLRRQASQKRLKRTRRARLARMEPLEPRMLLRANIGSVDLANTGDYGPFALSEVDFASEESGQTLFAATAEDPAGAVNLGDGSVGAVNQIATELYDPNNLPVSAEGLPELESLPDASVAIYLDFDGHDDNDPFDVDGDGTTFNATEQGRIWETWRQVAAYWSAFDANVTTIEPNFDDVPTNYELISNSISGGFSYLQFPTSIPRGI